MDDQTKKQIINVIAQAILQGKGFMMGEPNKDDPNDTLNLIAQEVERIKNEGN
jgi:hypothetical protein